jgi:7-keto-8-aminopelargonate synthetase-like enzyme
LCVDESSSLGILGVRGAGGLDDAQIIKSAPTIIASLGRGFGGYGAVVAGKSSFIEKIAQSSHTTSVEVATPPILSLFALAVAEVVEGAVTARSICRELARELYTTAIIEGYEVHGDPRVPIIDLVFSSREELTQCHKFLFDRGIYVSQLPGRLRFIVNLGVGEKDIVHVRETLAAFKVIRDRSFS